MRHAAAVLLIIIAPLTDVFGCECPPPEKGIAPHSRAEAIFAGVPISAERTESIRGMSAVRIKVLQIFKGDLRDVVTILTPSPKACGINFQVGEQYLVYASASSEGPVARHCEGTKLMNEAAEGEIADLRKPNNPLQATHETRVPDR